MPQNLMDRSDKSLSLTGLMSDPLIMAEVSRIRMGVSGWMHLS